MSDISINEIRPYVAALERDVEHLLKYGSDVSGIIRREWGLCANFKCYLRRGDGVIAKTTALATVRFTELLAEWAVLRGVDTDTAQTTEYPVEDVARVLEPLLNDVPAPTIYSTTTDKFQGMPGALRLAAIRYVLTHWEVQECSPVLSAAYKPTHGGYPG